MNKMAVNKQNVLKAARGLAFLSLGCLLGYFGMGLIVYATGVLLETSDVALISDANTAYLNTMFQVVKLLPYIAIMSGGYFLVNKLLGIIPGSQGGR